MTEDDKIREEFEAIHERFSELEKKIFHDYGGDLNKIEDAATIQIELVKKVGKLEKEVRTIKEPTENWDVIIAQRRCPHKYDEMHDSKWSKVCELTRKSCNIENCTKKYLKEDEQE